MLDLSTVATPTLNTDQMAAYLEVSPNQVRAAVRAGTMRPMPIRLTPGGKNLAWRRHEVQDYFEAVAPKAYHEVEAAAKQMDDAVKLYVDALVSIAETEPTP
jgi:hypothetical protein